MRMKSVVFGMMFVLAAFGTFLGEAMASGSLDLEIVPTPVASVSEIRVVREGGELLVRGKVRKFHEFFLPGHVDVVLCDRDGNPLGRSRASLVGHASRRGGVKEARFAARIGIVPAEGATVQVRYHAAGPEPRGGHACS